MSDRVKKGMIIQCFLKITYFLKYGENYAFGIYFLIECPFSNCQFEKFFVCENSAVMQIIAKI